jgi:hypothetical protein
MQMKVVTVVTAWSTMQMMMIELTEAEDLEGL